MTTQKLLKIRKKNYWFLLKSKSSGCPAWCTLRCSSRCNNLRSKNNKIIKASNLLELTKAERNKLFANGFFFLELLFFLGNHLFLSSFHLLLHRRHGLLSLSSLLTPTCASLLDRVEHGTHLSQPSGFNGRHALHVFLKRQQLIIPFPPWNVAVWFYLGSHDQFMVDHVVRRVAHTEQGGCRM